MLTKFLFYPLIKFFFVLSSTKRLSILVGAVFLSLSFKVPSNPPSKWDKDSTLSLKAGDSRQKVVTTVKGEVRIGISIKEFQKRTQQVASGGKAVSYVAAPPQTFTLRAILEEREEFYVGQWHILYEPIRHIKDINENFSCRLQFSRLYGDYLELEETLGEMILTGQLVGQTGLYAIKGTAFKRVRNKEGRPTFDFLAGSSASEEEIKKEILTAINATIKK